MTLALLLILIVAFSVSVVLTGGLRRYALHVDLLDHPNDRSSHSQPTPRGGGIAIVITFLAGVLVLGWIKQLDRSLCAAVVGAGTPIAALGFIDDWRSLKARWRFLGQVSASVWLLACLGAMPTLQFAGNPVNLGIAAFLLAALYIVWSINLFNFMDGIDGIASVQAICVSLGGALVWWIGGREGNWAAALLLAACVAGFLLWNFPPAKIFMGDAGSGFLGLMVAMLSLWSSRDAPHLLWSWLILMGCFMVDATTTLIRRVLRGEKFYEAHRTHAYQYASRVHRSHKIVSLTVGMINLLWLLPLAVAVATKRIDGLLGTLIAYAPLVWLAYRYKAGDRAAQAA